MAQPPLVAAAQRGETEEVRRLVAGGAAIKREDHNL